MITGFNTNVRHSGRTFHVQTEDSGRSNPHVISHLYYGGTILASEKREYSDLLGSDNITSLVRRLMEKQHKQMLDRLKRGEYSAVIAERLEDEPSEEMAAPEASAETTEPEPEEAAAAAAAGAEPRAFGDGIVSNKPLDEVILEYLVDKARSRKADGASDARGSRSEE